jgi:peptide/nickel transport system substrate-binding protein
VNSGAQYYNLNNRDRAKQLLAQAGYAGEPLVIITNSSFQSMYQAAVDVTQQLRDIGMNVRMDVFDWATASARLRDQGAWNLWFTGHGTATAVGPADAVRNMVSPRPNQFTADPVLDQLYGQLLRGRTLEERRATFAQIQERIYEQVLFLKFGDLEKIQASRREVKGFAPYRMTRFWNVQLE